MSVCAFHLGLHCLPKYSLKVFQSTKERRNVNILFHVVYSYVNKRVVTLFLVVSSCESVDLYSLLFSVYLYSLLFGVYTCVCARLCVRAC